MGYTHYWRRETKINQDTFDNIVKDFIKITRETKVHIAGGLETGKPKANKKEIWFNGIKKGDQGHETFCLPLNFKSDYAEPDKDGKLFDFCKTARKPYDILVTGCLIIAKKYLKGKISVSSDGNNSDWEDARKLCQETLGYGAKFDINKAE